MVKFIMCRVNEMQPNLVDIICVTTHTVQIASQMVSQRTHEYAASKQGATSARVHVLRSLKCDLFLAHSWLYKYENTQRSEMSLRCIVHDIMRAAS